jgi:hypothetical protein
MVEADGKMEGTGTLERLNASCDGTCPLIRESLRVNGFFKIPQGTINKSATDTMFISSP